METKKTATKIRYADEENKRFPLDTERHIKASLINIHNPELANVYDTDTLSAMKSDIFTTAKSIGLEFATAKSCDFDFGTDVIKTYEEEGDLYLIGEASGLEKDRDGERMELGTLQKMAKDIADGYIDEFGNLKPVVLKNTHLRDGITTEIGELTDAWVNENQRLAVKAKLYKENPDAKWLHVATTEKGKKFGLSIEGKAWETAGEYDPITKSRGTVLKDVFLRGIAVTSQPSWTKSWFQTIQKSFDKIEEDDKKEGLVDTILINKSMDDDKKKDETLETSEPEVKPENDKSDTPSESEAEKKPEDIEEKSEEKDTEKSVSEKGEEIEKATMTMDHFSHVSGRLSHAQDMVRSIASGRTDRESGLAQLADHMKTTHKMIKGLASGNTTMIDESMQTKLPNPNDVWMSKKEEEKGDEIEKSVTEKDEITKAFVEQEVEKAVVATVEKAMLKVGGQLDSLQKSVDYIESLPLVPKGFSRPVIKGEKEKASGASEFEQYQELYKAFERDSKLPNEIMNITQFGFKWNVHIPKFKEYGLLKK